MIAKEKQRTTDNGQRTRRLPARYSPRTRRASARRGVTLIEMLVTVAILVLIMAVVAQVFQAATGAVASAQAIMDLDGQLRRLESVIRSDLGGATASFNICPNYQQPNPQPPYGLRPIDNEGYFEYGENEFADNQGEDSDDYIKFTAKAPLGQPFTGRMFLPPPGGTFANMNAQQIQNYLSTQPITITSDFAEIIYFLRNGNLHRRVLLIAPQLQSTIYQVANNQDVTQNANPYNSNTPTPTADPFTPTALGNPMTLWSGAFPISWQGVNDLSARPQSRGLGNPTIVLNTLGDLSNRENRFAAPRFADDYFDLAGNPGIDGLADDLNDDNINDSYPSLYLGLVNGGATNQLIWEPRFPNVPRVKSFATMAFPYIFPGAYSQPQTVSNNNWQLGWIHSPMPAANVGNSAVNYDSNPAVYLQNLNHNPVDIGDNLPQPNAGFQPQTWWGFPTWRETLSYMWNDPTWQVNAGDRNVGVPQPNGLSPLPASRVPPGNVAGFLPAMNATWRLNPQLYTDDYGTNTLFFPTANPQLTQLWQAQSWEDDLIMTNVRSFDVKAYDDALAGYADLGWGDDPRVTSQLVPSLPATIGQTPFLGGNADYTGNNHYPPLVLIQGQWWDYIHKTFAHEGRMPPLTTDLRFDAQFGPVPTGTYPAPGNNYTGNVGDNHDAVIRLRRVWDSWSTEYSQAPATGQFINAGSGTFEKYGPPFSPPIYPSYMPPYPATLRAIQIQIRVADTTNQHVKSITIRQDFTEKL
jgi:prepilin-type N-terminal cleavage/methylation domain-containing protein